MRSGCSSIDTSLHWQASLDLSYKMARARFRRELTCTSCTVLLMWLNLICLSLIMWFSGRFRQKRIRRAPVGLLPPFLPVMVFMAFTTSFSSAKWCKMSCLRSLPCLYVKKTKQWQGPTCQSLHNGLRIGAPDVDADKCLTFPNDHRPHLQPTDPSTAFDSFDSDKIVDSDGSNQEVAQWFYIQGPHRLQR